MKHISFQCFLTIQSAFLSFVKGHHTPDKYLFEQINGYAHGQGRPSCVSKIVSLSKIRENMANADRMAELVKFAVLRHYVGSIVDVSDAESVLITKDWIAAYAANLKNSLKR